MTDLSKSKICLVLLILAIAGIIAYIALESPNASSASSTSSATSTAAQSQSSSESTASSTASSASSSSSSRSSASTTTSSSSAASSSSKSASSTTSSASSSSTSSKSASASPSAQLEPETGAILAGESGGNAGVMVTAAQDKSVYVKVKTTSGETVVGFYVQSGSTATALVPSGTYDIQFAMGSTWYGTTDCFGAATSYGQDKELTLEEGDIVTYELQVTNNGNFSMSELDGSTF